MMKINMDPRTEMILKDILNSGITENNLPLVTEDFVREVVAVLARLRHLSFRKELYEIMKAAPAPMTTTEIQFSVDNFVERYITNQKVGGHLREMVRAGMAERFTDEKGTVVKYWIRK